MVTMVRVSVIVESGLQPVAKRKSSMDFEAQGMQGMVEQCKTGVGIQTSKRTQSSDLELRVSKKEAGKEA